MNRYAQTIGLLAALLVAAANPAFAGEEKKERQRLHGYGWSLYDNLLLQPGPGLQPFLPGDSLWTGAAALPGRDLDGLLWRDPQHGLSNTIGSYLDHSPRPAAYQLGAGGEWYYGSLTAVGQAGYLEDSYSKRSIAGIDLRWYARDNISLQVGWEQLNNSTLGNLRLEYAPRFDIFSGLSFFAGASGDSSLDNHYFIGGLRYSFGSSGSLIRRDRLDPAAARDHLSPYFRSLWFEP